jgi:hypothetical protein
LSKPGLILVRGRGCGYLSERVVVLDCVHGTGWGADDRRVSCRGCAGLAVQPRLAFKELWRTHQHEAVVANRDKADFV